MHTKFLFIISLFFISFIGFSQSNDFGLPHIIPPSPNVAALGKYGEIPIGLFTGSPQVNIPLASFNTRNLSVPITLRYNSNGIRVDEYSSNVGLGWDLSVGGVITRQIVDDPDEQQQVTIPDPATQLNSPAMVSFLVNYSTVNGTSTSVDYQPDIYSFSFNGFSGRFFLDNNNGTITNRTPIFLEPSSLKIEVLTFLRNSTDNTVGDFKITDPNGIVYYFGGIAAVETSRNHSSCSVANGGEPAHVIENAWHLRKMIHPNGEEVKFIYQSKSLTYDNGVSQTVSPSTSIVNLNGCGDLSTTPCISTSSTFTSYLKEINATNFGKVTFTYSQKTGMPTNMDKLNKISLYDKNNTLIKEQVFEYQTHTASTFNTRIPTSLNQNYHKRRFFLHKVTEKSSSGSLKPAYEFNYYTPEQLPARFSFSQDYWGYYNGINNYNFIDDKTITTAGGVVATNQLGSFVAANRSPNFQYGIKGLLKKVTYPTGGYNTLYYDPHSYLGTETVLPTITTQTATIYNATGSTVYNEFTTPTIPFNQDADLDFIVNIDEAFGGMGGGMGGGGSTTPLTFLVQVKDAVTNQLISLYEVINGNNSSIANPFTVTVPNFGNQYIAKLKAGRSYKVIVTVSRANTTGTVKLNYYATNSTTTTTNVEVGGLRIAKVETSDGNGDLQTKNYHYGTLTDLTGSSGRLVNSNSKPFVLFIRKFHDSGSNNACDIAMLHSYSAFQSYAPYHIGYGSVIEEYGTNFSGGGVQSVFNNNHPIPIFNIPHGDYVPGTSLTNVFGFGQELEKTTFKKVGSLYKTLNKVENVYKHDSQLDNQFKAYNIREKDLTFMSATNPLNLYRFDITEYALFTEWHYLEKKINTQYDQDGLNPVITTKNYYYDNPDHLQLTRTKTTVSDDDPIITKTFYPDDVTSTTFLSNDALTTTEKSAIDQLKAKHRIAEPIQTEAYKDMDNDGIGDSSEQISVQRINYNSATNPLVKDIQSLKGVYNLSTNKLQDRLIFHSYYTNGNVKEVSKKDGSKIVYIWGYNEQFPIAKIENASYSEVSSQVANLQTKSNTDNDRTIGTLGNEGSLRVALTSLRNTTSLSDALVTTFTYDPLIGVTSVTDPLGQTIYYHYDDFNRLEMVTDKDNKVLSKNEYNYKN